MLKRFKNSIGWYPVSTLGWFITVLYFFLLIYVVTKINYDLYVAESKFFIVSILLIAIIVIVMIQARRIKARPFEKI